VTRQSRDLVVVGASAGGVEALSAMVASLSDDLPASVLVVLHMPAYTPSALPAILNRAGTLPAAPAQHGEQLRRGRIYVARPGHHLMVDDGAVTLSHGPSENGHRPAIDVLFRSAAVARGAAVTGVLLSGVLDDGVAGLRAIAGQGGRVIVQDPGDALYPVMPRNALHALTPDYVLPAGDIGSVLGKLVVEEVETRLAVPEMTSWENEVAAGTAGVADAETQGIPSEFSCPDCDGVLARIEGDERYRCRVGHAWTAEALFVEQDSGIERALWAALRALEEKAALALRMANRASSRGDLRSVDRYAVRAREAEHASRVLREQIVGHERHGGGTDQTA
jgi:two-component system chemotaxis response regulator CheB